MRRGSRKSNKAKVSTIKSREIKADTTLHNCTRFQNTLLHTDKEKLHSGCNSAEKYLCAWATTHEFLESFLRWTILAHHIK